MFLIFVGVSLPKFLGTGIGKILGPESITYHKVGILPQGLCKLTGPGSLPAMQVFHIKLCLFYLADQCDGIRRGPIEQYSVDIFRFHFEYHRGVILCSDSPRLVNSKGDTMFLCMGPKSAPKGLTVGAVFHNKGYIFRSVFLLQHGFPDLEWDF